MEDCKIENIQIRHKYAGPIPCSITISYGGVGQHHLFILSITRARQSQLPMIVTDPKGKVSGRGRLSRRACATMSCVLPSFLPSFPSFFPSFSLPCCHKVFELRTLPHKGGVWRGYGRLAPGKQTTFMTALSSLLLWTGS